MIHVAQLIAKVRSAGADLQVRDTFTRESVNAEIESLNLSMRDTAKKVTAGLKQQIKDNRTEVIEFLLKEQWQAYSQEERDKITRKLTGAMFVEPLRSAGHAYRDQGVLGPALESLFEIEGTTKTAGYEEYPLHEYDVFDPLIRRMATGDITPQECQAEANRIFALLEILCKVESENESATAI